MGVCELNQDVSEFAFFGFEPKEPTENVKSKTVWMCYSEWPPIGVL